MKRQINFNQLQKADFEHSMTIVGVPCSFNLPYETIDVDYRANADSAPASIIWDKIRRVTKDLNNLLAYTALYIKLKHMTDFITYWSYDNVLRILARVCEQSILGKGFKLVYKDFLDFKTTYNKSRSKNVQFIESCFPDIAKNKDYIFESRLLFEPGIGYVNKEWFALREAINKNHFKLIAIQGSAGTGKSYTTSNIIQKAIDKIGNKKYEILVASLACKRIYEFSQDLIKMDIPSHTIQQKSFAKVRSLISNNTPVFEKEKAYKIAVVEEASMLDLEWTDVLTELMNKADLIIMNGDCLYQHTSFLAIGDLFYATCKQLLYTKANANLMNEFKDEYKLEDMLGKCLFLTYTYRCKTEGARKVFDSMRWLMTDHRDHISQMLRTNINFKYSPSGIVKALGIPTFDPPSIIESICAGNTNKVILTIDNDFADDASSSIIKKSLVNQNDVWRKCYIMRAGDQLFNKENVNVIDVWPEKQKDGKLTWSVLVGSQTRPDVEEVIHIRPNDVYKTAQDFVCGKEFAKEFRHQCVSTVFSSQGNTYDDVYVYFNKTNKIDMRSIYVALTRHRYNVYAISDDPIKLEYYDPCVERVYGVMKMGYK